MLWCFYISHVFLFAGVFFNSTVSFLSICFPHWSCFLIFSLSHLPESFFTSGPPFKSAGTPTKMLCYCCRDGGSISRRLLINQRRNVPKCLTVSRPQTFRQRPLIHRCDLYVNPTDEKKMKKKTERPRLPVEGE